MHESESEIAQLCPTLSNPMDCSLPGSSIHGIFQARVLEWGAIAFSKASTNDSLYILQSWGSAVYCSEVGLSHPTTVLILFYFPLGSNIIELSGIQN